MKWCPTKNLQPPEEKSREKMGGRMWGEGGLLGYDLRLLNWSPSGGR